MKKWTKGFTLAEILIVVSIISILAAVIIPNFNKGTAISRDAQRKADLREIQTALELYKHKYGRYPAGCRGATTNFTTVWSGENGTSYACPSGGDYIVGLAPEFISPLPHDPKLNGVNSGYVYAVNTEGSVYKIMAMNTVETEVVTTSHDFFRCDSSFDLGLAIDPNTGNVAGPSMSFYDPGICQRSPTTNTGTFGASYATYSECTSSSNYQNTYALSGGISTDNRGNSGTPDRGMEYDTAIVRCK